jgi:AbrB family looped-hinge helix DNA binding protein
MRYKILVRIILVRIGGCTMRITSKGQITIPVELREKYGLLPHTEVEFVPDKDMVRLRKATTAHHRGSKLVAQMRGRATIKMSTKEIMALTRGE